MTDSAEAMMRPRYVVVWPISLTREGLATLKSVCAKLGQELDAYEEWPEIPSGADLYDYRIVGGRAEFTGCWQTFSPKLECSIKGKSGKLQLCVEKDVSYYCYASRRWCEAVARWQRDLPRKNKGFGIIPYSEFASVYLASSKI